MGLEPPEVAADAREARLDLVGDAEAAGLPHSVVRQGQVPRRHLHDPTNTLQAKGKTSTLLLTSCALPLPPRPWAEALLCFSDRQ